MSRKFLIRIRLEQLRSNLSRADGREYSLPDIRQWLRDAGFLPLGDAWLVDQANLGHLNPAEVADAQLAEPGVEYKKHQ